MLYHLLIISVSVVHPDGKVFHRFLWTKNQHNLSTVYQWLRLNLGEKAAHDIASNTINILAKASQNDFPRRSKGTMKVR